MVGAVDDGERRTSQDCRLRRVDLRALPVMTTAAATTLLSRYDVDAAIDRGDLQRIGPGAVVGADLLDDPDPAAVHALHVRAAQVRMTGLAVASHGSAALLHGLARLGRPTERVRLTRGGGRYRRLQVDARLHVCGMPAEHVTTAYGVTTTTPARTVVDLARMASFRSGVVTADSALRQGCSRADLDAVAGFCRRWPGVRRARRVIEFASAEAESPLESISRVFIAERGLPAPELQAWLGDEVAVIGRVDFYWREEHVVGEADGLAKYTDADVLRREKLRQEMLEDAGFIVVRWTWDDIWRRPDETEARIRRALERGRRRHAA